MQAGMQKNPFLEIDLRDVAVLTFKKFSLNIHRVQLFTMLQIKPFFLSECILSRRDIFFFFLVENFRQLI